MRKVWTYRDVDAPASQVWDLLVDPGRWSAWGPSVRSAELHGNRLELGATGTVTTAIGASIDFEITRYEQGARWAWKVAGIEATDHTVEALADGRSRVGFGVPWIVAPYQAVCQLALHRIKKMAETETMAETLAAQPEVQI